QSIDVWMIVDTGADFTILPRHFSQKLRISLEHDCIKDTTVGVGGNQAIYFYKKKIQASIGRFVRPVPLAFFDNNEVPALLGRLGFLETFDTEFFKQHTVVFKD
ncbi:MAG: retropepsin-like aspartic protease, partial [bacterium]|nr:retropepsin-like aspartic protease [bacterium]